MADAEVQPQLLVESVSRRSVEVEDWSSVAGDILEQVLVLLSFPEVYRLRSVCKRWNALIRARFHERGGQPWGPFHTPRIMWGGQGMRAGRWFAYDISKPTLRKTTMPRLEFPECARKAYWHLIAAGGGLLCFGNYGRRRILVCNPMTQAWRELPYYKGSVASSDCLVMVTECGSSYKIIFAGPKRVDLYSSVANKWSTVVALSPEMSFQSGDYYNDKMYLLGKMVSSGPYVVMILELDTLRWREDTILMPATSVEHPYIVAWSGEAYLVGVSSGKSILLFRLDTGGRWTRVSENANHAVAIYGCGAHCGRIFVVTCDWVAVYNCARGVWEEPVMGNFISMMDIYKTKFAFQPNLVAVP